MIITTKNNKNAFIRLDRHLFRFSGVSVMVHGSGVSQFTQIYNKTIKIKMMPFPYLENFEGDKGNILLKEQWK